MGQDSILSQILTSFSQKQKEQTRDDENNAAQAADCRTTKADIKHNTLIILIGSCQ
jgi:hypothetical protein